MTRAAPPALPASASATPPACIRGPIPPLEHTLDELPVPEGTEARALAVHAGRIWILTADTLMEHDGKRVVRETALCGGENRHGTQGGYWHVAADDHGALALGSDGKQMTISTLDVEGHLACRDGAALYPASAVSQDGVWMARTRTGVELRDASGWRGPELRIEGDSPAALGVASRRHALLHVVRARAPWQVYSFDGASWNVAELPGGFVSNWMSPDGVTFAFPVERVVVGVNTSPDCEPLMRIEKGRVSFVAVPLDFRPIAVIGRSESNLWFPGRETVFHWDGASWRQASLPARADRGVVDEDGAFWFVGQRSVFRIRRK